MRDAGVWFRETKGPNPRTNYGFHRIMATFRSAVQYKFQFLSAKERFGHDCVFNLAPATAVSDTPLLAASSRFWALPYAGGGGPVLVSKRDARDGNNDDFTFSGEGVPLRSEYTPWEGTPAALCRCQCFFSRARCLSRLGNDGVRAQVGSRWQARTGRSAVHVLQRTQGPRQLRLARAARVSHESFPEL